MSKEERVFMVWMYRQSSRSSIVIPAKAPDIFAAVAVAQEEMPGWQVTRVLLPQERRERNPRKE